MRIAINASSLTSDHFEILLRLANRYNEHIFLFFFDSEPAISTLPSNVHPVIIKPQQSIRWFSKTIYQRQLAAALKKHKAGIFISEAFVSSHTNVPQILISPDLTYIFYPALLNKKQFSTAKKNTPKFLQKAATIVVNSYFFKNKIEQQFGIDQQKIKVVYPSLTKKIQPVSEEEKIVVKEKYAGGNEYFIYHGIISMEQNLVNLLKAFSFFKKRQRSKMRLFFTGKPGLKYDEFIHLLASYKFKNEVMVKANESHSKNEKLLSCAYASLYIPFYESEGKEILETMSWQIPLVVSNNGLLKEYCGEAALYADPDNFNDIADKMMLIFKDEQKRHDLIENGTRELKKFTESEADNTWYEIIKEIERNDVKIG
jgi:glycosyltransferase involved in cell wall biosynthesis